MAAHLVAPDDRAAERALIEAAAGGGVRRETVGGGALWHWRDRSDGPGAIAPTPLAIAARQHDLGRARARSAPPTARPRRAISPRSARSVAASTIAGSRSAAWKRSSSRSPTHFATTIVATPLPMQLVSARPSLMIRSIPTTSAMPTAIDSGGEERAAERLQRGDERDQAGAGDAGGALGGEDHQPGERDLLADRHVLARRLDDEQRAQRQVDAGAVEIERVARRDHHADGLARGAGRPRAWRAAAAAPSRTRTCRR